MSKSLLKSSSANRKGVASVAAPLPTSKRITVPFSNLFLSKSNVRSAKDHSEEGIRRLAAMIEAGGLLGFPSPCCSVRWYSFASWRARIPGTAAVTSEIRSNWAMPPWHFLYFLPLPQGQGSLRPTLVTELSYLFRIEQLYVVLGSVLAFGDGTQELSPASDGCWPADNA